MMTFESNDPALLADSDPDRVDSVESHRSGFGF
jgi:hypothetical protein